VLAGHYTVKKGKTVKYDIFVIRVDTSNNLCNARPCYNCLQMMKDIGIKRVYYSVNNNIICEKVNDMVSINASNVARRFDVMYYNAINEPTEYYKNLLLKYFPKNIKIDNLKYFLEYNYNDALPNYTSKIKNDKIIFYDNNKKIVLVSIIIFN
jgi:hypothetical protein